MLGQAKLEILIDRSDELQVIDLTPWLLDD